MVIEPSPAGELTVREAAQEVSRAEETIRRWIWSGRLPAHKRGNVYYIAKRDLKFFIDENYSHHPAQQQEKEYTLADWMAEVRAYQASLPPRPNAEPVDVVELLREARQEHEDEQWEVFMRNERA